MSTKTLDREYHDEVLTKVEDFGDGWAITGELGTLCIPKKGQTPHVGDVARFYGKGFGYPVRGVDINGAEVYYETARQYRESQQRRQQEQDEKDRKKYIAEQGSMTERITALPGPMQKRLFQFRERSPDFGWKFEGYELACSEMAAAVAKACEVRSDSESADEWFARFREADWTTQEGIFGKASEGASGNMASFAIRQAYLLVTNPRLVPQDHGALCVLVGCDGFKACDAYWAKQELT